MFPAYSASKETKEGKFKVSKCTSGVK